MANYLCTAHSDRAALVALYNATADGDSGWIKSDNWLSDAPIGDWHGVTTDSSGRVTRLRLFGNGLSGEIPAELGSLANLEFLYLVGNQLSGEIPAELGELSKLKRLWLHQNRLSGEIPAELGSLANLEFLYLVGNQLSGEIPAELGELSKLKRLWLNQNQLSGEIPAELGILADTITTLFLSDNQLTGCVPAKLAAVKSNDLDSLGLPICSASIPDLVVEQVSVSKGIVAPGERFTLRAAVRNTGAGDGDATTLRYYRSTDDAISTGDVPVGHDPVSSLQPSDISRKTISLAAPSREGTYYYGACVDPVSGESNTENNCSVGALVTVGANRTNLVDPTDSLLRNGGFNSGLDGWEIVRSLGACGRHNEVNWLAEDGPRSGVAQFFANGNSGCGNSAALTQELDVAVPDGSRVEVAMTAKTVVCTTWACHMGGFESPAWIELTYRTDAGEEKRIQWQFQYRAGSGRDHRGWSGNRYLESVAVQQNEWFEFTSVDAKTIDPSMVRITKMSVVGNGWDYDGRVDSVALDVSPNVATAAQPDAEEELQRAVQRLRELRSSSFDLKHIVGSTTFLPGIIIHRAYGKVAVPDEFDVTVEAELLLNGSDLEIGMVSIDGSTYMTNVLDGVWGEVASDTLPLNFGDFGGTLARIVERMREPALLRQENMGGTEVYRVGGAIMSEDLKGLVPSAETGYPVALELLTERDTGALRQVLITGQVVGTDLPGSQRLLTISDLNQPVNIITPQVGRK